MTGPVFTNNAVGALAASYGTGATALTLTAGQGVRFPSPGVDEWFAATIVDASNNIEIVHCTGRTADTLTVQRAREGTIARALGVGEKVEHRLTAAALAAIRDRPVEAAQIADGSVTGAKIANGAVDGGKIANGSIFGIHLTPGAVDASILSVNAAVGNIGFMPVQQGGGAGMEISKVYIGWTALGKLAAQVDVTPVGFLLTERQDGSNHSAGYRGVPINVQNADYTLGFVDNGRCVLHSGGDHTYTLPNDVTAPFSDGATIQIINRGGGLNIVAMPGTNLQWVPSGVVAARALVAPGVCTVERIDTGTWWIYGVGVQ